MGRGRCGVDGDDGKAPTTTTLHACRLAALLCSNLHYDQIVYVCVALLGFDVFCERAWFEKKPPVFLMIRAL